MLLEAARSDRLVAEEKLPGGKDADALAYLARRAATRKILASCGKIALADVLSLPIAHSQATFQGHADAVYRVFFGPRPAGADRPSVDKAARHWEPKKTRSLNSSIEGDGITKRV
jgi:hypothetical protein